MPIPIERDSIDATGALRVVTAADAAQPTHKNAGFQFDATGALVVVEVS